MSVCDEFSADSSRPSLFLHLSLVGLSFGIMTGTLSMVLANRFRRFTLLGFSGELPGFLIAAAGLCLALIRCQTCWGVTAFVNDRKDWTVAPSGVCTLLFPDWSVGLKGSITTFMSSMTSIPFSFAPLDLPGVHLCTSSGHSCASPCKNSITYRLY